MSFIIALCLTIGGAVLLIDLLFFAAGWRGWMLMASVLIFVAGATWLYVDFIDATPNETIDGKDT
jgi:hypothetical protein